MWVGNWLAVGLAVLMLLFRVAIHDLLCGVGLVVVSDFGCFLV